MEIKKLFRHLYLTFRIRLSIGAHGGLDPTFAPTDGWTTITEWRNELLGKINKDKNNAPMFVRLGKKGTALRRKITFEDELVYYRDGGNWETGFRINKSTGKIFTVIPHVSHIHNKELFETTEEDWAKDNGQYAYQ